MYEPEFCQFFGFTIRDLAKHASARERKVRYRLDRYLVPGGYATRTSGCPAFYFGVESVDVRERVSKARRTAIKRMYGDNV